MKQLIVIPAMLIISGCGVAENEKDGAGTDPPQMDTVHTQAATDTIPRDTLTTQANERFRNVMVTRLDEKEFKISGEAQVFEATISWKIEDGHNVLKEGHETTDAGAPEWGRFEFTVTAEKERENSTLVLILYEASAKDGSHQHELPLMLY